MGVYEGSGIMYLGLYEVTTPISMSYWLFSSKFSSCVTPEYNVNCIQYNATICNDCKARLYFILSQSKIKR